MSFTSADLSVSAAAAAIHKPRYSKEELELPAAAVPAAAAPVDTYVSAASGKGWGVMRTLNQQSPPHKKPVREDGWAALDSSSESDDAGSPLRQKSLAEELADRLRHTEEMDDRTQRRMATERTAEFYSKEGVNSRLLIMEQPNVKQALEELWACANCVDPEDEVIDKSEYKIMHRKIVLHLQPMATPNEAMEAAEEDWLRDSMGEEGLSKERFIISWFELADLWTEDMSAEEYEEFLRETMEAIVRRRPDGLVEWQRDREARSAPCHPRPRPPTILDHV